MKKFFGSAVVLATLLAVAMGNIKEFLEKHGEMSSACVESTGFSEDQVMAAWTGEEVPHEGHCYMECVMEKLTIVEDNKFMPDKAKHLMEVKFAAHPEKIEKAHIVIDECAEEVTTEEKCETGHELFLCFKKKKAEHDIEDDE